MFWILQKDFSQLGVANNNDFSDQSSEENERGREIYKSCFDHLGVTIIYELN